MAVTLVAVVELDLDGRMVGTVPVEVEAGRACRYSSLSALAIRSSVIASATPIEQTILISSFSVDPMTRRSSSWSCFTRSARSWSGVLAASSLAQPHGWRTRSAAARSWH